MTVLLTFAVVAIAELSLFMAVEARIGLGNALLLALATAVVGSILVRRAGSAVLSDFRRRMGEGAVPARELTHGAAVLVAGALLISPGFLTDLVGFALLVPAVRDVVHHQASRRLRSRVTVVGAPPPPGFGTGPPRRRADQEIIDVESWEER